MTLPPVPDRGLRVGDIVELVTSALATRGVVNTLLKDGVSASVQWDNGSGPVLSGKTRIHRLDALRKIG